MNSDNPADDEKNGKLDVATRKDDDEPATDVEGEVKKLPYPKSIAFIISNEFCERFCYYGMRTILVLYLTRKLGYDDDVATIIYHTFTTLVYFMCVFGAILSDSWLGKFNTILYLSIVYACGSIIVSLGAMPPLNLPGQAMTILGLVLIALGSGGIKPCVAAFGGDQFKLPDQVKQMATFFSLFYFSINAGSLISTSITPILRQDVSCFEQDDCYSLAFGVPGALMVISIVIFVCGKFMYKINQPSGNMVVLVSRCIGNAISTRMREKKTNPRPHWLEYAEEKYGKQLVHDTKILLNILVLYIPLPVFWSLFDQQGSRWTFQATRMDGELGFYEIKPDQMQVVNPLLILVFIPIYDMVFYPLLSKIGIRRPLQKLTMGGILAGVAFLCSAAVELNLEQTYPVLPIDGESQFRLFNTLPCNYNVQTNIQNHTNFIVNSLELFQADVPVENTATFTYTLTSATENLACPQFNGVFTLNSHTANSYFIRQGAVINYEDNPDKSRTGDPILRMLINPLDNRPVQIIDAEHPNRLVRFEGNSNNNSRIELLASSYEIMVGGVLTAEFELKQGSVTTVLIVENPVNTYTSNLVVISIANSVHMLWLLPQYIIMTLGEVMFSITGLAFSYSQAPVSMKAVLQACWLLTVAFGNVIDIIVVGAKAFESQASEFFLFAGLMFVDMLLFMYLAYRYKTLENVPEAEELMANEPAAIEDVHRNGKELKGLDNVAFTKDSN